MTARDSFFTMLNSVRLIQEVSRSSSSVTPSEDMVQNSCSQDASNTQPAVLDGTATPNTLTPTTTNSSSSSAAVPNVPVPTPSSLSSSNVPLFVPSYAGPHPPASWLFAKPTPPTTSNTRPRRKHARKNSHYTVRHHRAKQPSASQITFTMPPPPPPPPPSPSANDGLERAESPFNTDAKIKHKSQKLLCLWPLPIITRCVIGISVLLSLLNCVGILHLKCSSPSFVLHRFEVVNLLLSPFLLTGSLQTVLLSGWNILILGLFEESLAHILGGTRRFVAVLVSILFSVCLVRQGIGYLFSKSTGFAVPSLFFSDSLHECSQGLAPFLFALLIIQSLGIEDKYILMYGSEDSNRKVTVRKMVLQLLMCLVNYAAKNILWWSVTGLLTGFVATLIIQMCLSRENQWHDVNDEKEAADYFGINEPTVTPRQMPMWRLLCSAVKKGAFVVLITLPVLLVCNAYYTRETFVDPATLNQVAHDRYMFTFVVMTAPRRGDPAYLTRTLDSYLQNWPVDPDPGSLYDRIHAIVYTHFSNHTQFDLAKERFSNDLRGSRYLKWVRESGDAFDQRLHVSKALSLAADNFQSTYVALVEDDFPVCGKNEWRQIENVVYAANQRVPGHCGVFVGTGGSGLFIKPKIAKLASGLLLKYTDTPPDVVLQQCLSGDLPECSECSQTLVTSKTLLMYHIGFNTSTSTDRSYKKHDFQCGWRHPFNGNPDVITL